MKALTLIASLLVFAQPAFANWDHIFVIVLENVGYESVIGNPADAPYINNTLLPQAALYTQSFGVAHPSLPNYLALFSGDIQEDPNNTSDHCVANNNGPFNAPNLYHSLLAVNRSVSGFFEALDPSNPMSCDNGSPLNGGAYVQKHNPFAYFTSGGSYNVPTAAWQPYTGPSAASWPNLAFIVPDIPNDMHYYNVSPGVQSTLSQQIRNGDAWLAHNLPDLISYCNSHNGLIILTMDESSAQHLPTILVGANVGGGRIVTQVINHYNVTKTITDNFGAPPIGRSTGLSPLTPPPPLISSSPRILNISTRVFVETGDKVLIGGFIIPGSQPKKAIVRAIGPSLTVPGVLLDPMLELHDSSGAIIAQNDNWQSSLNKQAIIDTGIPPTDGRESAIVMDLKPGPYTAVVRGANGGSGIALVEVYDLDQAVDSELANISTRGLVETGDNVMIAGFIIQGTTPEKMLVRALGPSLVRFGITNPLANPILELRDVNGNLVASNNDWRSTNEAGITATGLQPSYDLEPAILASLNPGNYTAIVRGVNNAIGIALVEAYDLQ